MNDSAGLKINEVLKALELDALPDLLMSERDKNHTLNNLEQRVYNSFNNGDRFPPYVGATSLDYILKMQIILNIAAYLIKNNTDDEFETSKDEAIEKLNPALVKIKEFRIGKMNGDNINNISVDDVLDEIKKLRIPQELIDRFLKIFLHYVKLLEDWKRGLDNLDKTKDTIEDERMNKLKDFDLIYTEILGESMTLENIKSVIDTVKLDITECNLLMEQILKPRTIIQNEEDSYNDMFKQIDNSIFVKIVKRLEKLLEIVQQLISRSIVDKDATVRQELIDLRARINKLNSKINDNIDLKYRAQS